MLKGINQLAARSLGAACALALLFLTVGTQAVQAKLHRQICESCRRYIDGSPGQCRVRIEGEHHVKTIGACSAFCLFELLEDNHLEGVQRFNVVDYTTLADEVPLMLLSKQVTCLYGPECDFELTNEPFVFYFGSEDDAKAVQQELGGSLKSWSAVAEKCEALAADWEPEQEDSYQPLRKRERVKEEEQQD